MLLHALLSSLITAFYITIFGRFLNKTGVVLLSITSLLIALLISFISFYEITYLDSIRSITIFEALKFSNFELNWELLIDQLTISLFLIVLIISLLVQLYSYEYMGDDPHIIRFFLYLNLFTFFMLLLVSASNFFQLFVGWEGVGLCSYLLISFWFTRTQANLSSLKAFIINRIGDVGFLLAIFLVIAGFSTLDFQTILLLSPKFLNVKMNFFGFEFFFINFCVSALFLGVMSKSAQIFLHTWLPDAMEGPTPVSALIHAATMVAAGVFLLARCSGLFSLAYTFNNVIVLCGASTAFFAATIGFFQNDIKKIVAYSTCSQLGYMVLATGYGLYSTSVFHLINHAFFKALLFLVSGSIIHSLADIQDIRRMGLMYKKIPLTYLTMIVGSLSLMGVFFFSGFYSKDLLIEQISSKSDLSYLFSTILVLSAAFITSLYSTRLFTLVFFTEIRAFKIDFLGLRENGFYISLPLFILALFSLVFGFLIIDFMVLNSGNFWRYVLINSLFDFSYEFLSFFKKNFAFLFTCTGIFLSSLYCLFEFRIHFLLKKIIAVFFNKKWFFDEIYSFFIIQNTMKLAFFNFLKLLDKGFFEKIGPIDIEFVINILSKILLKSQSGFIYHYLMCMILVFVVIVLLFAAYYFFSLSLVVVLLLSYLFFNYF